MQRSVTVHYLATDGSVYKREPRDIVSILPSSEPYEAAAVVTIDSLGRQATYDLGNGLPLEGGDSILCNKSMLTVRSEYSFERRQLSLPLG